MKKIIITLLSRGYTTTKKDIKELSSYCFFIRDIAEYDEAIGLIRCNNNEFWKPENNDKRLQLIRDIKMSHKGIRGMFTVLNEHANGHHYGIA